MPDPTKMSRRLPERLPIHDHVASVVTPENRFSAELTKSFDSAAIIRANQEMVTHPETWDALVGRINSIGASRDARDNPHEISEAMSAVSALTRCEKSPGLRLLKLRSILESLEKLAAELADRKRREAREAFAEKHRRANLESWRRLSCRGAERAVSDMRTKCSALLHELAQCQTESDIRGALSQFNDALKSAGSSVALEQKESLRRESDANAIAAKAQVAA